jgi:hypothetical protein
MNAKTKSRFFFFLNNLKKQTRIKEGGNDGHCFRRCWETEPTIEVALPQRLIIGSNLFNGIV